MPKSGPDANPVFPDPSRRRWTQEEARAVVSALEGSGLSVDEFAAREGFKPERVSRWARKLRSRRSSASVSKFVELRTEVTKRARRQMQLVLPSGHVLFIGESFDTASLHRVLDVLERDPDC
jgi:transposase-like protein